MQLLSLSEFIGRFHPLIVHLPIGILLIALLLQWLSQKKEYTIAHGVLKLLWALGSGFAILSCITGYLLSVHDEYDDAAVALHMWCGIAVAAVSLLLLAKVSARQNDVIYKSGAIVLFLLITATGHLGGSLTHGSDYLFSALDADSRGDSTGSIKPIANVQEAQVYGDIIKPIFQTKCYNCHGPRKQKHSVRLDDTTRILKGGEDGPVLLAGDAKNSDLLKSLLLPREDKKHMPPKEKPQLTENQIALIRWWIDTGLPFHKKVAELPQAPTMKPILAALEHGEMKKLDADELPQTPVEPANAKAIAALKDKGVVVLPVAQNINYLEVNFTTATNISDKDISLLLPLKKQMAWVKLGNTNITDSALKVVSQCANLYSLWLDNTKITDAGLKALQPLKNLQVLNLVGTSVTAAGLVQLQSLKNLKSLYLYQTKVNSAGWQTLKGVFPHTRLDTGGYHVPTLPSDTTEVKPPKIKT